MSSCFGITAATRLGHSFMSYNLFYETSVEALVSYSNHSKSEKKTNLAGQIYASKANLIGHMNSTMTRSLKESEKMCSK